MKFVMKSIFPSTLLEQMTPSENEVSRGKQTEGVGVGGNVAPAGARRIPKMNTEVMVY